MAIDFGDAADLAAKIERAVGAIRSNQDAAWQLLANQGVFRGSGSAGQVAFLYTGQGSQYVNMLASLRESEPIVAATFAEADAVMEPILGKPLSDYIFIDTDDAAAVAASEVDLMQTEITQPAVLTVDIALTRLMDAYGIEPSMVMGHSLGEYGALVAAGSLPFDEALMAVAGRGREMASVEVEDRGLMAAVFAPMDVIERNGWRRGWLRGRRQRQQQQPGSHRRGVRCGHRGNGALVRRRVSGHPAPRQPRLPHRDRRPSERSTQGDAGTARPPFTLDTAGSQRLTGEFYPRGPQVESEMIDILGEQIAAPVQFVKGLERLYAAGARVFVEMGPKRALQGHGSRCSRRRDGVTTLFANHPKQGDVVSFNQALCGLYALGLGAAIDEDQRHEGSHGGSRVTTPTHRADSSWPHNRRKPLRTTPTANSATCSPTSSTRRTMCTGELPPPSNSPRPPPSWELQASTEPVVVTGAGLGLPGIGKPFDETGLIAACSTASSSSMRSHVKIRQEIVDHHITRLVKSKEGGGHFESIDSQADVIKLAGQGGPVDLVAEFGFPEERAVALDRTSELAIAAGIDALRDAGIPLTMRYKKATTGKMIPERWMLPEALRDGTGVIFASAFPGADAIMDEVTAYTWDRANREHLDELRQIRNRTSEPTLAEDLDHRIHALEGELETNGYMYDRRYLYRALSFAHAQFAEYIGARGPNTQVNAACAIDNTGRGDRRGLDQRREGAIVL